MHPLDVLGDPVRRRILEVLASGEQAAGALVQLVGAEFGITQPAVSRHLRVLREAGFTTARVDGSRRVYATVAAAIDAAAAEVGTYRPPAPELPEALHQRLDALHTEVARGQRERRLGTPRKKDAS